MLELYGKTELVIDCSKTVKELLALGRYDSVSDHITDENFPPEVWELSLMGVVKFHIFCAIEAVEFEEMAIWLYKAGCKGTSLRQGLNFGIQRPQIHRKLSLVLPGSFWRDSKTAYQIRNVPRLSCISGTRHVYLRQLDQVYPAETFFLATALV